ncbi:MAG: ABC transporter ATP-binding protein, partial [Clostridia bacterium]|nr:ABC transporter ATP-binding protein [Clostridia bacterium]
SALDYATESRLKDNLTKYYPDCTKLIVAQRVSAVRNADLIIVMDDGEIVGAGTHEELEQNCGEYRQICIVQTGGDL